MTLCLGLLTRQIFPATHVGSVDADANTALSLPATQTGDLILVLGWNVNAVPTISGGGTWTFLTGSDAITTTDNYFPKVWWQLASASQGNPTVSNTNCGSSATVWRGASNVTCVSSGTNGNSDITMTGFTKSAFSKKIVIMDFDRSGGSITQPSGFTDRFNGTAPSFFTDHIYDISPSGYTDNASMTITYSAHNHSKGALCMELT